MNIVSQIFRRSAGAVLALALALPLAAQPQDKEKSNSPSEKAAEAFGKLRPLMEAKDFPGILKVLDAVPNPSLYDQALILDMRAKVYMNMEQYTQAIGPQEAALKLSDENKFFSAEQSLQTANLLARLIYAEAINIKDKPAQAQMVTKAAKYLKRFLDGTKKPSPDDTQFYAQLLYAQATSTDPINLPMLREARQAIEEAMLAAITPKESFYQLLVAMILQENDYTRSAEILELVVQKYPQKKDYWPQLMLAYLQLANSEKDEARARERYVRAINTVERAQSLGIMTDPKNNYNLVTFYIAAGQFSKATDILHAGLKKGTIESTVANWRILGSYYQQANKELQAIESLKEAAKLFPKDGMIDLHIGEIHRGMEKTKEAREAYRVAVTKKDTLEKPHIAYQLLAFAAMEFEDWDEAFKAVTEAAKYPDFQKDKQMMNLKSHIETTVKERNAAKEAEKAEKDSKETKKK